MYDYNHGYIWFCFNCLTLYQHLYLLIAGMGRWIHAFPKGFRAKGNVNSLGQNLNSRRPILFLQR